MNDSSTPLSYIFLYPKIFKPSIDSKLSYLVLSANLLGEENILEVFKTGSLERGLWMVNSEKCHWLFHAYVRDVQCVALQLSWSSIVPVSRKPRVRIPLKPWYFQAFSFYWKKITAMITLYLHLKPQYKYEFHMYFTSFHRTGRYELNKLTGIAEVTDSNPVSGFFLPIG